MMDEVEKIFVDIINHEIDVNPANVWIQSQNVKIPTDPDKLFVAIGMVDAQVIANNNTVETPDENTINEVQEIVQRENIQIDIFSRDNKARTMRWEIQTALKSIFSQQQQEKNNFRIFRIPTSFVNSSEVEGTSELNRFSIVIPCHVWYRKVKTLSDTSSEYYDDFSTRVDDEQTIGQPNGLIEFNIKDE